MKIILMLSLVVASFTLNQRDGEMERKAVIERDGLNSDLDLTEDEFLDKFHLPPVDDPVEKAKRAESLHQHQHEVKEVNEAYIAGNKTWYDKINKFSDIPADEFIRTHTGLLVDSESQYYDEKSERFYDTYRYSRQSVPASYNSVSLGHVTPVKDQGNCGSCVAFSAMALVETCFAKTVGVFGDYSEQQLLDCAYNPDGARPSGSSGSDASDPDDDAILAIYGCDGAYSGGYVQWLAGVTEDSFSGDLASEDEYPYEGGRFGCRSDFEAFNQRARISDMFYTYDGDEETMKKLVAEHGAVGTSIMVNSYSFSGYEGGVYAGCDACVISEINHAVTVVGYGSEDGEDYWLVKNSWGSYFGDEGYIKIKRGVDMCCIGLFMTTISCEDRGAQTSGVIQSPNYPDTYPDNNDQTWNLEVAEGQTIELIFDSFATEEWWDYVRVSFGSFEEEYSGSEVPDAIVSSGNTMTVTFHSDIWSNRTGFKATWNGRQLKASGEIETPLFREPDYPYPDNLDETWYLEVAAGQKIKLTFNSFDIECTNKCQKCKFDYVQVSEEKYCGSTNPDPIISSGNNMTVTFHSDHKSRKKEWYGFNASWEAVEN